MLKFYRTLKLVLALAVILAVFLTLFYENFRDERKVPEDGSFQAFYNQVRSVVTYDPYERDVLSKVRASSADFKKSFFGIAASVSNLISGKDFYNNVFIFMVSRRADGISGLIRGVFADIPSFSDLVILDRDQNVIYKYGSESFVTADYPPTNDAPIRIMDNTLAVSEKYRDETLDSEIRIIALFNTETAAAQMKSFPYPAFLIVSNRVYRNTGELPDILKLIRNDLRSEKEYPYGFSVVRTYNIVVNRTYIGTFGITYPARSIPSILLILLKVLLFIFLVVALITGDNFIENRIKGEGKAKKKTARAMNPRPVEKTPEEDEADTDARLDWIEHYVKVQNPDQEKKNERNSRRTNVSGNGPGNPPDGPEGEIK